MIDPAETTWPPKALTPSIFGFESRPLRVEPPPFFCAIACSCYVLPRLPCRRRLGALATDEFGLELLELFPVALGRERRLFRPGARVMRSEIGAGLGQQLLQALHGGRRQVRERGDASGLQDLGDLRTDALDQREIVGRLGLRARRLGGIALRLLASLGRRLGGSTAVGRGLAVLGLEHAEVRGDLRDQQLGVVLAMALVLLVMLAPAQLEDAHLGVTSLREDRCRYRGAAHQGRADPDLVPAANGKDLVELDVGS